jgi:nitroreductase
MDLLDAIMLRHTTNSKYSTEPIKPEHIKLLIEAAARCPSHFNSQPWRFVLIQDAEKREMLAQLAGTSMKELMEGSFFQRYKQYFRFSDEETASSGDGLHIDYMPAVLRPFIKQVFSPTSGKLMKTLGVSKILGENQADIVRCTPLIMAITMNKTEYKPGELSGLYSSISLGAAIQTFWLVTTSLNMGMQFISVPLEVPERKALISDMLGIPDSYDLVALLRMGYRESTVERNTIDWVSSQRKPFEDLASMDTWGNPIPAELRDAPSLLWKEAKK